MITVENADKVLKDYYLDAVSAQLNNDISPFFSAIEKNTNNVFGKDVNFTVIRDGIGSISACAEDGCLPTPYKNRYLGITVPLRNLYGTIEISDKALRASRDRAGAFVNLLDAEMEGLVQCAKKNFRRMLFGDGSGLLCNIISYYGSCTFTVDKADERFVGMCVDIYAEGNQATMIPSVKYTAYIVDVDTSMNTVTFDNDFYEITSGGKVYISGGKDGELTGLGAIFDSDTLYGYSKNEELYLAPYIADGNCELTEEKMCDVIDTLEEKYNSRVNMILCSYKTRKKIAALVAENKLVVNSIDVHTGVGAVTVNGVPVYADKYCPDDRVLFLNTDDFCLCQLCDWEWLEDESGKILKQIPGRAAYSATLVKYAELICKKPCGQGMLTNISV